METSLENSFQSKGKNFILKSDYLNNTNNSRKNSKNNDSSINFEKHQKIAFQEKDQIMEKNRLKNISLHASDKDLDSQMFINNNIFNKNKNKNNNIIHEDNIEVINDQLNNMNLQGNEININNEIKTNPMNINNINKIPNINFQNIISDKIKLNQNQTPHQNQFNPIMKQMNPYNLNSPNIILNPNANQNNLLNNNNIMQNNNYFSNNNKPNANSFNLILSEKREEYLINNCVNLCKEQIECRQLQKILEEKPSIASNIIYYKIKDKIQEISFDQFGNYFIQKVIEYLTEDQIKEILYQKISPNFRSFCFNQHGTRVVQKIFEKIKDNKPLLNFFNNLLIPNLKDFVLEPNASHIIIKYANSLPSPQNDFLIQFLIENSFELATKKYSCCVLQKCIEYSNEIQKKKFLKAIALKSFGLFNDQFGNYVVQYCINLCDYEINKIFVENFMNNILKFSTQKYSSNIIEKCMECCDEETRELICNKFCDKELVEKLLFDMYGNYVLQKVISLSKEPLTSKYLEMIGPLMKNLNNYNFGQKLYNKLLSSFPNLSVYIGIKGKHGKNKKYKKKKNNNNMNNNMNMNININNDGFLGNNNYQNNNAMNNMNLNRPDFSNNIFMNNNNFNMKNNINNKNNLQILMPEINNYFIPFQLDNNNNINPNNIQLQNYLLNKNFAMNNMNHLNNNNLNEYIKYQQQVNLGNNIDRNNNFYNINQ